MRAIQEVDAEGLRAKLAGAAPDSALMTEPFRAALAEYDALKARGEKVMLYVDRGLLVVGTLYRCPKCADVGVVPSGDDEFPLARCDCHVA